jgi:hypothetical protein
LKEAISANAKGRVLAMYDKTLARRILERLGEAFPIRLDLHKLQATLPEYKDLPHQQWLLALEALRSEGKLNGKFLKDNTQFVAAAQLYITEAGRRQLKPGGSIATETQDRIRGAWEVPSVITKNDRTLTEAQQRRITDAERELKDNLAAHEKMRELLEPAEWCQVGATSQERRMAGEIPKLHAADSGQAGQSEEASGRQERHRTEKTERYPGVVRSLAESAGVRLESRWSPNQPR